MKTVHEVLLETRALLSDEAAWTQGAGARNGSGVVLDPFDREATCWCLTGALSRASGQTGAVEGAIRRLKKVLDPSYAYVALWNDSPTRTHAEVLDLLDRALEA